MNDLTGKPKRAQEPDTAVAVSDLAPRGGQAASPRLSIAGPAGSGKSTLAARLQRDQRFSCLHPQGDGSTDIALIVVDGREGLTLEARRDIAIACASGATHLILAVNKLDLAGWKREAYELVVDAARDLAAQFAGTRVTALPISALTGDNVSTPSAHMPWNDGEPLAGYLKALMAEANPTTVPLRLPVQSVSRVDPNRRRYEGTIACGRLRRGDRVQVAVSGVSSTVTSIMMTGEESEQAGAGERVGVSIADHVDISGGDVLVDPGNRPEVAEQFAAHIAWLSDEPLLPGRDYTLHMATRELAASVNSVKYRIDLETTHHEAVRTLRRGEVGTCTIATSAPVAVDPFTAFPATGRFTLSDRYSGAAMAAGIVDFALRRGVNVHAQPLAVSKNVRAALKGQAPCILWFTGLSGAGKSTIANHVEAMLTAGGCHTYLLDGDNVRHGLTKDLGFTTADRVENIRRVGEVAKLFVDAGLIVLCSFISPFRAERSAIREIVDPGEFIEIHVSAPLAICEGRDPKGLYAKSRAGRLPNFTGVDSPYEPPEHPDLVLDTTSAPAVELAKRVVALLRARRFVLATSADRR